MSEKKKPILLLDLGGVVFGSTGQSNPIIDWSIITQLNHEYGHALNIGEDRFGDFMAAYNQRSQQQLTGQQFLEAVFDTLTFNQELVDLIRPHYRIYIASDNYRENIHYIAQRYHFTDWSEGAFYSFELGMVKENPAFFTQVLETLQVPGEELVLIDDSPHKLASALSLGIRGVHFQGNTSVRRALFP